MSTTTNLQVGTIMPFIFDYAPLGWLICDGQEISPQYELSSQIKKTPDLRGRTLVGSGRAENSITNFTLGEMGGEEKHKLSIAEMPSHDHGVTMAGRAKQSGRDTDCWWSEVPGRTEHTGGNQAHNIMQPYYVTNYIIYAGIAN